MRMLQWPELIGDGVCDARTRQKSRGVQLHIGRRACAEGIHTIWCPTIATGSYTSDACFLAGSRRQNVDSAPGLQSVVRCFVGMNMAELDPEH